MSGTIRRGFTVTEMMIVIGIFIVLISVAIPATSKVRQSAMRTDCLMQMRGLQFAYLAYAQDHRGHLLPFSEMAHSGLTDEQIEAAELPYWYFILSEYYDTPLVLKSPLDESKHWPASMGGQGTPLAGAGQNFRRISYGLNDYLMAVNPLYADAEDVNDPDALFDRLSKIRSPRNTMGFGIVAFEGENAGSDHFHPEDWLGHPVFPAEVLVANFMQTNAHGGPAKTWDARSGYSFLDGSVGTDRFSDLVMPGNEAEMNKLNPHAAVAYTAQQIMSR